MLAQHHSEDPDGDSQWPQIKLIIPEEQVAGQCTYRPV